MTELSAYTKRLVSRRERGLLTRANKIPFCGSGVVFAQLLPQSQQIDQSFASGRRPVSSG